MGGGGFSGSAWGVNVVTCLSFRIAILGNTANDAENADIAAILNGRRRACSERGGKQIPTG